MEIIFVLLFGVYAFIAGMTTEFLSTVHPGREYDLKNVLIGFLWPVGLAWLLVEDFIEANKP